MFNNQGKAYAGTIFIDDRMDDAVVFFPTSRLSQNIETFETEIKAEKCVKRVRGVGIRIVSAVKWTVEGMVKEQGLSIP